MAGLKLGSTAVKAVYLATTAVKKVYVGATLVWNSFSPSLTPITATGAFSYTVPSGATAVDLVGVGGGRGGQGMTAVGGFGHGGQPGAFNAATLVVGTDIAAGATITGSVGAGGAGSASGSNLEGSPGNSTTFSWTDPGGTAHTLTCLGGTGGNNSSITGIGTGDETYNGQTYTGSTNATTSGATGHAPGGGGAGAAASSFIAGGHGGSGEAWLYAY